MATPCSIPFFDNAKRSIPVQAIPWCSFIARATDEKARAAILHPNAKWRKKAECLVVDYIDKLVLRTVEEQAAYLYSYFHMRAHQTTTTGAVLDPVSMAVWTKGGGVLEEHPFIALAA